MQDDTDRPAFIPVPVWRMYRERAQDTRALNIPVARLLGLHSTSPDNIDRSWRELARAVETAPDWCLLFDLFWTLPETFDPAALTAVRDAQTLAPTIAARARELAGLLNDYRALSERHMVTVPDGGLSTFALIREAGLNNDDLRLFEQFCLPHFGVSVCGRVDIQHLPAPHDVIDAIADAFEGFEPVAIPEFADYANAEQPGPQVSIINHFEDRWAWLQGRDMPNLAPPAVMAARFQIGPTALARILSALFYPCVFSRETVNYARGARGKPRKYPREN